MKERPILFKPEMVNAILEGRKTQTRRLVPEWQIPKKNEVDIEFPQHRWSAIVQRDRRWGFCAFGETEDDCVKELRDLCGCRLGMCGEQLWVRENIGFSRLYDLCAPKDVPVGSEVFYPASMTDQAWYDLHTRMRPSIHAPRWTSRIQLHITGIRIERLHDISEEDAKAEGTDGLHDSLCWNEKWLPETWDNNDVGSSKFVFATLWQSINGPGSWAKNEWVWVIEFKKAIK